MSAATTTSTVATTNTTILRAASPSAPNKLPFYIAHLPKLEAEQAGHLRHFHNLVTQPDGEWRNMGPLDGTGECKCLHMLHVSIATPAHCSVESLGQ